MPGRLLLAENDASLSRLLSLRLHHFGWSVSAVEDGTAAVEAVHALKPDALLLDLQLPGLDGLEVLKQLRGQDGAPPVILMSGYLDRESTLAAIAAGAAEVLEKPVAPQVLRKVLLDVTGRRDSTRPSQAPKTRPNVRGIVGDSRAMHELRSQIIAVAHFPEVPVLVIGETGTGKEVVANALHRLCYAEGPLIAVNCAALPESLFESELFGHAAGSFTGARSGHQGLMQTARGGTLFLDEVGELAPTLQSKLLRVLETRTFRPVGSNREVPLEARIIAATNRELAQAEPEVFRSDLYYRLAGYTLRTPPLREHLEDVAALAHHFLTRMSTPPGSGPITISEQALWALQTHAFPGNVRELRAILQAAAILASGPIGVRHIRHALQNQAPQRPTLSYLEAPEPEAIGAEIDAFALQGRGGLPELERRMVERVYSACGGNVSRAARELRVPRSTLRDRLKRYGLD